MESVSNALYIRSDEATHFNFACFGFGARVTGSMISQLLSALVWSHTHPILQFRVSFVNRVMNCSVISRWRLYCWRYNGRFGRATWYFDVREECG